jgi:NhaP-type Na+/H+ or K+/H+ antiporter
MMRNPIDTEKAFAYLGIMLGVFPPLAFFVRILSEGMDGKTEIWIGGILSIVILLAAIVGYFSGILVGRTVRRVEARAWSFQFLATPFLGLFWGLTAGAAGGIIIFVIGAIFGAILGAAVGFVAVPAFALLHRLFKRGDMIDMRHFLPLAFGVTLTICSFILGV